MRPLRIAQSLLIGVLVVFLTGASDPTNRYEPLGHKLMCICGCNQVLIECNHVGCSDSSRMLAELRSAVYRGDSDRLILETFQAKYGPTALASPMFTRFNMLAWIAPPAVLALGALAIVAVVRRWKRKRGGVGPPMSETPEFILVRDEIRRETEI